VEADLAVFWNVAEVIGVRTLKAPTSAERARVSVVVPAKAEVVGPGSVDGRGSTGVQSVAGDPGAATLPRAAWSSLLPVVSVCVGAMRARARNPSA
jgi:hypothetical protein